MAVVTTGYASVEIGGYNVRVDDVCRVAQGEVVFEDLFNFVVGEFDVVEGFACFTVFVIDILEFVIISVYINTDIRVNFNVTVYVIFVFRL